MTLTRDQLLLAALSPSENALYEPVHLQKLLFVLEREISSAYGGPLFNFQAYDYGPFDKNVYRIRDELVQRGLLEKVQDPRGWPLVRLTRDGQQQGSRCLEELPANTRTYVRRVNEFVRTRSFQKLVSAIYRAYPDMKENSVFRE